MHIIEGMQPANTMKISIHMKLQQSSVCMLYEVVCVGAQGMPEMDSSWLSWVDDIAAIRERWVVAPSHINFTEKGNM